MWRFDATRQGFSQDDTGGPKAHSDECLATAAYTCRTNRHLEVAGHIEGHLGQEIVWKNGAGFGGAEFIHNKYMYVCIYTYISVYVYVHGLYIHKLQYVFGE